MSQQTKKAKKDQIIEVKFRLTVAQARALRDELYCVMSDYEPYKYRAGGWDFDISANFQHWWEAKSKTLLYLKRMPGLGAVYLAVRKALEQPEQIPVLNGPYTTRQVPLTDELYRTYLVEKFESFYQFYGPESMTGDVGALLKRLSKSIDVRRATCVEVEKEVPPEDRNKPITKAVRSHGDGRVTTSTIQLTLELNDGQVLPADKAIPILVKTWRERQFIVDPRLG